MRKYIRAQPIIQVWFITFYLFYFLNFIIHNLIQYIDEHHHGQTYGSYIPITNLELIQLVYN